MTLYRNFKSCGSISGLQFGINESLTNIPGSSQCVLKNHFLTSLAGRSANIAALPFLLVSVHTSLTKTTSLPDMERGESDHPWLGHVQTPLYNPSWPPSLPLMEHVGPLSLPVHSLLFQQCHSEPFEGGTARDEWEPERQRARLDHFFTSSQMFTTQHNSCTLNTLTYT